MKTTDNKLHHFFKEIIMDRLFLRFTVYLVVFFICNLSFGQLAEKSTDSLTRKEHREEVRQERKSALKASHKKFVIKGSSVFSNLKTDLVFGIPYTNGLLSTNLSLENNFGLASNKTFFTGSFLYFITPRSGIYAQYYGIKRQSNYTTQDDLSFLGIEIPAGKEITAYFDTQVFSFGYLLTIVRDSKLFFGTFFNISFIDLGTGVYTEARNIDETLEFVVPIPNFGLLVNIEIASWLYFDAAAGFFALDIKDSNFSGSIYNLNLAAIFKPTEWLGLSLSYEMFDVDVSDRYDIGDTYIPYSIDYHFSGPALGVAFNF